MTARSRASSSYQAAPVEPGPGDIPVVYSDGLIDAGNGAGEERLKALIQSTAPRGAEALDAEPLTALDRFTQGAPQTDDVTFLSIGNRRANR